jgi:hypothetical protein
LAAGVASGATVVVSPSVLLFPLLGPAQPATTSILTTTNAAKSLQVVSLV